MVLLNNKQEKASCLYLFGHGVAVLIDPTALGDLAHFLECTLSLGAFGGGLLFSRTLLLAFDMCEGELAHIHLVRLIFRFPPLGVAMLLRALRAAV
jgi:hypothetical protein